MTAKERFRLNKELVTGYNDIVDSTKMQAAFDHALLYFLETLNNTNDPITSAANAHRTEGAQRLIILLKNLNSEPVKAEKPVQQNLQHQ